MCDSSVARKGLTVRTKYKRVNLTSQDKNFVAAMWMSVNTSYKSVDCSARTSILLSCGRVDLHLKEREGHKGPEKKTRNLMLLSLRSSWMLTSYSRLLRKTKVLLLMKDPSDKRASTAARLACNP